MAKHIQSAVFLFLNGNENENENENGMHALLLIATSTYGALSDDGTRVSVHRQVRTIFLLLSVQHTLYKSANGILLTMISCEDRVISKKYRNAYMFVRFQFTVD